MRKTNEFPTKVANEYVRITKDKRSYNIAYSFAWEYLNSGKCGRNDIIEFLKKNCINKKIDIDALIMSILSVEYDRTQEQVNDTINEINAILGIPVKQTASYPDKETILDIIYKNCTRKAYEVVKLTLDEFDSDEIKIIRKFVEVANRNMILVK